MSPKNKDFFQKYLIENLFIQVLRVFVCVLVIFCVYCSPIADTAATRHDISKRNYSDQTVKGYLAEVSIDFFHLRGVKILIPSILRREHAGGTRFARRNFTANFAADARNGLTAGRPGVTTTRSAASPGPGTYGSSPRYPLPWSLPILRLKNKFCWEK